MMQNASVNNEELIPMYTDDKHTQGTTHDKCDHIIQCDAKNCAYNDKSNYCVARKINVGPTYATDSEETVCNTFTLGEK